jgi:thiol-disulfide isomerase/thioredoxin
VLAAQFAGMNFEVRLPPGDYSLDVYASKMHSTIAEVKLSPGSEPQEAEPIRLRATRLALLEGQPAPEIPGVVAWKNSPPLKLADLRGKCVLLDFWGYWCGVCVNHMPEKFELYDKYHDQGLEVIGVHTDLGEDEETPVATVEELDRRLAQTRKELWKDRDLPFPVALVVGKRTPYGEGIAPLARSATAAEWGVHAYPTHILIDRRGNVVGKFWPTEEGIKLLEEKLAEK